jgi:hypothetical protein
MGRELWARTNRVMLVLISGSLVTKMKCLSSCWASDLLAKKNWPMVMLGKKGLWGLKMLLRRRNTTSLMKFHPLTFHTSPNSWELTKHRTCEATIVKKFIYIKSRKKKQDWFLLNPYCNVGGCVYWWKWNPFCNIKDGIYWWNFNHFCNIWDVVEFESCL